MLVKLVSRFKRILKRNFRNASLLSLIFTRSFHLNVKENQHATKAPSFGGKAKLFFRPKTYWFAAWKQFEWGRLVLNEALDRTSWPNFFVLLRVASLVLQALVTLSALKKSVNSVGTLRVRSGKESFGFKKLLELVWTLVYVDEVVSRRCKLRNRKTGE